MRILFVVRLFTGLKDGLRRGAWKPGGVIDICRVIEALDRSPHEARFVFTVKDLDGHWARAPDHTIAVEGLTTPVTVLAGVRGLPRWLGRARGYLRELRQAIAVWRLTREFRPDLMYFDRGNVHIAALAARLSSMPVVWRLMGVPLPMHEVLDSRRPLAHIARWAYRSPFAKVIYNRDGSGGEQWMDRALWPMASRWISLNGVDVDGNAGLDAELAARLPDRRTKVLFVARLVDDKGCIEFIAGFLKALAQEPRGLFAVIVGDGPYLERMQAAVAEAGADSRAAFLGQIPHDQVIALHRRCEVYVSMNRMCNLNNANLEAMKLGACMIIPASPGRFSIDRDTDALVPRDAVVRIESADDVDGLAAAIVRLHRNPDERAARARRTEALADTLIPSWEERISGELRVLESVAAGRSGAREAAMVA